jgi:hypothetical protein
MPSSLYLIESKTRQKKKATHTPQKKHFKHTLFSVSSLSLSSSLFSLVSKEDGAFLYQRVCFVFRTRRKEE